MWGQRTVGGDLTTTDVWEVVPSARVDNYMGVTLAFLAGAVTTAANTITYPAHGLITGQGPFWVSTSGTLPAPLTVETDYWIVRTDADTIKVAETRALSIAGTAVDLTTQGTGTHTLVPQPTHIPHLATGGVQTRVRNKVSCAALRVTGSLHELGDPTAAVQRLRFSDDNGVTWSNYYEVALPGASEVAFRSLGSFAAPGRIFELSDTGGLVRIDGVFANIPEVDNGSAS